MVRGVDCSPLTMVELTLRIIASARLLRLLLQPLVKQVHLISGWAGVIVKDSWEKDPSPLMDDFGYLLKYNINIYGVFP